MQDNSATFAGDVPGHYDRDLGPVIFTDYATDLARRVVSRRPMRVLETAAGTGMVTRRLRDALPAGAMLTATDLNRPMLEVAKAKFRPGEQVDFRQADATALPFGDGAFDAVACQFGLMFFPDKPKSFQEARRVLASGGRYLLSVWDSHRHNRYGHLSQQMMTRVFPDDPPQFYGVPFSCHQIDPIKEMLIDAGFTAVEVVVLTLEKEIDATAFARGLLLGGPVCDQISARGRDPRALVEPLALALRDEFGSNPTRISLQAIVLSATKP